MEYDFKKIEKKWQKKWEKEKIFEVKEDPKKDKFYCLIEFPYPSGEGLHVGHPRSYTALDIVARKNRMQGKNVLYPIGWDAFGLPTENYAIKTGIQPAAATEKNIKNFTRQLKSLGFSFDWSRAINTTDPEYYKWTQWMFLQFFKHGLAYKDKIAINWCTKCKIGLANEEVVNGVCERCGGTVEKRMKEQWMIKITKYAERLLQGLKKVDYSPRIKEGQINWIGKSEGAEVDFAVRNSDLKIKVFTTRPDTLFGATYMVLAPEHELVQKLKSKITNWNEVEKYIGEAKRKSDLERTELQKEKTGVELEGIKAVNPVNNEEIPIWVADYVLTGYGTGAIMAVPAHDERDFAFAKKFGLPIREVVVKKFGERLNNAVRRDGVAGVVLDKDKKVLVLHDKKFDIYRLPAGGYEKNEKPEETLKREIQEESGYVNIKIGEFLGTIETNFDVIFRKEYRHKLQKGYLVQLLGEEQDEMNEEGKEIFEKMWLTYGEAMKRFAKNRESWGEEEFIRRVFEPKERCFAGEGTAINSDFLNELPTAEAKEKIIKWLEEKNIGKKAVNYKLRDWVFSRQRYWGEPIPLVYCEACKNKKYNYILIHGFKGHSNKNFFPWLKSEVEKDGHQVFCPDLPNTRDPNIEEQVDYILAHAKIDENTILVGHSLGGAVTMKLLEKINKKVAKVLFTDSFVKPEFTDHGRSEVEKSCDWKFNFAKIKKLSDEFIVLADSSFTVIPEEQSYEMKKSFDAELIFVQPMADHFDSKKEPTILEQLRNTGWQPVEEKDLPVELPKVKKYEPTDTGESPLAAMEKWVVTKCPKCGGEARRETDTMPNWAGSSWYFMRYTDPENKKEFASGKNLKYWMPVDWYNGGMEHNNLHLLYSRFWYKFLYDIGAIPKECGDEPYKKRTSHGLILGEGGEKMSKSRGNVVNPDDIVARFGADTLRVYEMFMGPFEQAIPWDEKGVVGVFRFLERVWRLSDKVRKSESQKVELERLLHQTIKKVGEDIEAMKFNTAVSALMILTNEMAAQEELPITNYQLLITLLAPFAPHLAEELWEKIGNKKSVHLAEWPKYDPRLIIEKEVDLVIQVNSKVRSTVKAKADVSEKEAKEIAIEKKLVDKKNIIKTFFPENLQKTGSRILNIVTVGTAVLYNGTLNPTADTGVDPGAVGFRFTQVKISAGSTEALNVEQIIAIKNGTAANTDVKNITLYNDTAGTTLGTVAALDSSGRAVFSNLALQIAKGGYVELSVKADMNGGSGKTIAFDLHDGTSYTIKIIGVTYNLVIPPFRNNFCAADGTCQVQSIK